MHALSEGRSILGRDGVSAAGVDGGEARGVGREGGLREVDRGMAGCREAWGVRGCRGTSVGRRAGLNFEEYQGSQATQGKLDGTTLYTHRPCSDTHRQ